MLPRRRIARVACLLAACILGGGCLSDEAARRVLRKDLPRKKTAVMARIVREGKTSMTGELIRLLDSDDEGVRFMAATSLHRLTGIDRGFHFAEGEKRKAIVQEWHRWYEAEAGKPVPEPEPEPSADEEAGDEAKEGEADEDEAEADRPMPVTRGAG